MDPRYGLRSTYDWRTVTVLLSAAKEKNLG